MIHGRLPPFKSLARPAAWHKDLVEMATTALVKFLTGLSGAVVACDGKAAAPTKKAATASADGMGNSALVYGAAAASALALLITGYHYYTESEEGEGGADGKEAQAEADDGAEAAEAALLHARDALNQEWNQTSELNKASNGTLGFQAW